jgi:DNA-binding CsgD family transcriptional regulator
MQSVEFRLHNLQTTVDHAVLDHQKWVDVCDRLAEFIGGVGTAIVPDAAEYQVPGLVVYSPSLEGLVSTIFRDGWIPRNYRRHAIPLIKQRGFATDYDIADERTMRMEPFYADLLATQKLGVFVGINIVTTSHTFIAAVERAASAPPPDDEMFQRVGLARHILSEGARASVAVGALRFQTWKEFAPEGARAVFVLDRLGNVIDRTPASETLIGNGVELSQRRLRLSDPRENQQLSRLIDAVCSLDGRRPLPRPVFTTSPSYGSLMIEAVRLPESLRYFHSLAAAMVVVQPVENKRGDLADLLRQDAGLTTAELKIAIALYEGKSLTQYAAIAGLSTGTVRQQLKSVFRKTGTGRQNELSALIRRLIDSSSN